MLKIGDLQIPARAVLAPMAGVTDLAYRRLLRELGCQLAYTEFVSADGLLRKTKGSLKLIVTAEWDHPLGVQLFGSDAETIAEAARMVVEETRCDVLDLNMGCWVPKVIKRGAGAALLKDPPHVEKIVRAVVDAVDVPVTAKIRAGWTSNDINAPDVARAIEAGGADLLTLHARARSQGHSGEPDWSLITHLKEIVSIPVVGNGGLKDAHDAARMLETTGCDAVMIARGALGNPWIFSQIEEVLAGREPTVPSFEERMDAVRRLITYETDLVGDERRATIRLRGELIKMTTGMHGAVHFRRGIDQVDTLETALAAIEPVFRRASVDHGVAA